MERSLYIVNTPFQCIMAVILKERYDDNKSADVIITDAMVNSKKMVLLLQNGKVFESCLYYSHPETICQSIKDVLTEKKLKEVLEIDNDYTKLFVCMSGYVSDVENACYDLLYKCNKNIQVHGYVEGYSSYTEGFFNAWENISFRHKCINKFLRIVFKRRFIKQFDKIYAFNPELFISEPKYTINDISDLDISKDTELRDIIFRIFGYSFEFNEVKEKYVFFEECFSEEQGRQEDVKIVDRIASVVGKENIIIKRHPRNRKNRFRKLGYKTMMNQEIPWEVYALDEEQPEHILITFSSGATLNFRFLTKAKSKTILLYRCYSHTLFHEMEEDTQIWFEKYAFIYKESVFIPEHATDLDQIVTLL